LGTTRTIQGDKERAVLGAKADGQAAAVSTRGLLITILGEFVRPGGGTAWTQSLIQAMALVGVQEKAARQMILRLHEDGWLTSRRIGRRTNWALTPWATDLLTAGADRIYQFGQERPRWDQRWLVLLASMSEAQRGLRYPLTVGLTWAGFGSLGQGVWISPWQDREAEATNLVGKLGLQNTTLFRAEVGHLGNATELAARAWDLDAVGAKYRSFVSESQTAEASDPMRELVTLVHRWRHFPTMDPGLPAELLPKSFPAAKAAEHFAARRKQLLPEAWQRWTETEGRYGGNAK